MKKIAFVVFALLIAGLPLQSQVEVTAELDSARILIGDQVNLTLRIARAPGVQVSRVDWAGLEQAEELEIVEKGRLDTVAEQGGTTLLQQQLRLTSFDSGYHRIPPVAVHYLSEDGRGVARTNDLVLQVATFPIQSDSAALAPIKTIIEEPLRLQDVLPYVIGALLLLALALGIRYLLLRRSRPEAPPPVEIQRPAHEIALEKLAALEAAGLWQQGQIKTFHSELTHILREYLENRYRVRALESTSQEIVAQLADTDLEASWRHQLGELLRRADLVKFAKATPPADLHREALKLTTRFVEATRKREEAPAETGGESAQPLG